MKDSRSGAGDARGDPEDKLQEKSLRTMHSLRPPSRHKLTEANSKFRISEYSPLMKSALKNRHRENNAQLSGIRCSSGFDNDGEENYLGARHALADFPAMDLAGTIYQNPELGNPSREAWNSHDQQRGFYGSKNRNYDQFTTSTLPLNGEIRKDSSTQGREFQTWANFVKKVKLSNNPSE
jgi:hypothetical protein